MKIRIDIDDALMLKAQALTEIFDINILVEKALQLLIIVESKKIIRAQGGLLNLRGKVELDDEAFK